MIQPALATVEEIVRTATGDDVADFALELEPLAGGLVSAHVARGSARYRDGRGRRRLFRFVVKHLIGAERREAEVYRRVVRRHASEHAPSLLAVEEDGGGGCWLFLEWVRPHRRWPWNEPGRARLTAGHLADLHRKLGDAPEPPPWDYEAELGPRARETVRVLEELPADPALRRVRRAAPGARRMAEDLRRVRRQLVEGGPLPATLIHGDLHPGNVLLRRRGGALEPVLLDWARLRRGSPLEDLAPWLQTLAYWEPLVRRRHDRVLSGYLEARGFGRATREVRDAYWLAAGLNALAGALTWNLGVYFDGESPKRRRDALRGAEVWARAIRQADRRWRAGGR